ncbi:uncharacterized protein F4822DRAFT_291240 [Hypoxylon trugodes]|uniref:uncharacterized protein n=1 Tax=Hypoxylon trugodes TaxID=326681 RepID=UPI002191CDF6|nr:uncharacterized protein F4822DRAFT_291240 [Hypoxylon trugodes]KAI1387736.1 hypothetical protein F4822DRAFT_291240 [Hypoxylon trugodes]
MTSMGSSRHIACKLCRERKVRCPGEQPTCEKCRRMGEQCIYLPMQRGSKASLNQTVEAMQKRLDEAETFIQKMGGQSNNNTIAGSPYSFDWFANTGFSTMSPPSIPTPSMVSSGGANSPSSQPNHQDMIYQQSSLNLPDQPLSNELLESLQATVSHKPSGGRNDPAQFRMSERPNFDRSSIEFYPQMGISSQRESHDQRQGQDVTRHARNGSTSSNTPVSPSMSTRNDAGPGTGCLNEDTGAAILDPFSTFCSSVVRRQCEMSGVASAVADYIAWIRSVPPSGAPLRANSIYQEMLQNIEIRVRELIEISQAGPHESFRETLAALERAAPSGGAVAARLASLEGDLQKKSQGHSDFFQNGYDACRRLSEQRRDAP